MSVLPLAALVSVLTLGGAPAVRMPPAPAGMHALRPDEQQKLLEAAAEQAGEDTPELSDEVDDESAELEELRALEAVTLDPTAHPSAELLQSLYRLGHGNPLRLRLTELLEEGEWQTGTGAWIVTDLASLDVARIRDAYDIPIEMQPLVAQYIQFFQGPGRRWYRNWMARSTRYIPLMRPILEAQGLPKDTVYLAMIESGFSAHAYSWAHASGPWQFISSTGKQYGLKQDFWVDERRDPVKSTQAAARYLSWLYQRLGHWYLAWAGYNTGDGRVRRMVEKHGTNNFFELISHKGLPKETQHYVPKLIAAAIVSKHYEAFGFRPEEFEFQEPLSFDEVQLTHATDLEVAARAAGVPSDVLRELNPELRRWCTPPASEERPYVLRVPAGTQARFDEEMARIPPSERLNFAVHRIKRGDTLSALASRYGTSAEAVMRLNGLQSTRKLKLNSDLVIPVPPRGALSTVSAAQSRGFVHRPEEEIPTGRAPPKSTSAAGTVKTERVGSKVRVTYGVASGDTLWALSQRFDVRLEDLRRWNRLPRKAKGLQVGTELVIWPGKNANFSEPTASSSGLPPGGHAASAR